MDLHVRKSKSKRIAPSGGGDVDAAQLWAGIRAGEPRALAGLFERFYSPLYAYGCRLGARPGPVKDAIQELFCILWGKRRCISPARSVRSYLFHSLRRILLRSKTRQQNRRDRGRVYAGLFREPVCNAEELMVHFEADREKKEQLARAMDALSVRQREAVSLKYYEGLSNGEIAAVMGIGRQSVYNHVSEAIARLQGCVKSPNRTKSVPESR